MKILLVRTYHTTHGEKLSNKENQFKYRRVGESLALGYLSAVLESNGYKVTVIDAVLQNLSHSELIDKINSESFDILGMTTNVYIEVQNNLKVLEDIVKRENSIILLGGHVASFVAKNLLEANAKIDLIIKHEGELTLNRLVERIENQLNWKDLDGICYLEGSSFIENCNVSGVDDLNELPYPKRTTIKYLKDKNKLVNVATSRGCYGRCSFCSVRAFNEVNNRPWRGRSAKNVVDELEMIFSTYGHRNFLFVDDNFAGPGKNGIDRMKRIANEIISRGLKIKFATNFRANDVIRARDIIPLLKQAGLTYVFIGTESGSQGQLDFFKKGTSVEENILATEILVNENIGITQGLILFDYRITLDELRENLNYAMRTEGVNAGKVCSKLLIYHGTGLYKSNRPSYMDYSFDEPITPEFDDPNVKRVFEIASDTILWGSEFYNYIEDLFWDSYFRYDSIPTTELKDLNEEVNSKLLNYILKLTELVPNNNVEQIAWLNDEISSYLFNRYDDVKNEGGKYACVVQE